MERFLSNVVVVAGLLFLLMVGYLTSYPTLRELFSRPETNVATAAGSRVQGNPGFITDLRKANSGVCRFEGQPVTAIEFGETQAPEQILLQLKDYPELR